MHLMATIQDFWMLFRMTSLHILYDSVFITIGTYISSCQMCNVNKNMFTYLQSIRLENVQLAHWTAPLFYQPRINTRLVKNVSVEENGIKNSICLMRFLLIFTDD